MLFTIENTRAFGGTYLILKIAEDSRREDGVLRKEARSEPRIYD
jgi:hypothetical protein